MKRFTFDILNSDKFCYEEWYDEQNRIVYLKDHRAFPVLEIFYAYDNAGNLIEERTVSGGRETEKTQNLFNANGDQAEQLIYYSGQIYEKTTWDYSDSGNITRRFDETGKEKERIVENRHNGTQHLYQDGELVEVLTFEEDLAACTSTTRSFDGQNFLLSHSRHYFNDAKQETRSETLDEFGIVETETTFAYDGDKLIEQNERDHVNDLGARAVYTYDKNGNQVSWYVYHQAGRLLEWKESSYDAENRVVSEKGFSNMFINSRYIEYYHTKEFHFRHTYQDQNQ
jgi:hypothetical protein